MQVVIFLSCGFGGLDGLTTTGMSVVFSVNRCCFVGVPLAGVGATTA